MSDATGHSTPTGKIIDYGTPLIKMEKNVETAANVYSGRLVAKGTSDYDIKVGDGIDAVPIAWALYEQESPEFKKDSWATVYNVNDKIKVGRGGNFCIYAWMPKGFEARQGDKMFSFTAGQVVPGQTLDGQPAIAIPFSKNTSETDTNVDFALAMVVSDVRLLVETAAVSATVTVGLLASESGDADGFLVAEIAAVAGLVPHENGAGSAIITQGVFLSPVVGKDANTKYFSTPKEKRIDGTAISPSYNTSSHTIAGRLLFKMQNSGIREVGVAEESVSSVAAAARIWVRNTL